MLCTMATQLTLALSVLSSAAQANLPKPRAPYAMQGTVKLYVAKKGAPLAKELNIDFKSEASATQQRHDVTVQLGRFPGQQWTISDRPEQPLLWQLLPEMASFVSAPDVQAEAALALGYLKKTRLHWRTNKREHQSIGGIKVIPSTFTSASGKLKANGSVWLDRDNIIRRCWMRVELPRGGAVEVTMDATLVDKTAPLSRSPTLARTP